MRRERAAGVFIQLYKQRVEDHHVRVVGKMCGSHLCAQGR